VGYGIQKVRLSGVTFKEWSRVVWCLVGWRPSGRMVAVGCNTGEGGGGRGGSRCQWRCKVACDRRWNHEIKASGVRWS
jgi:hypothetical protein